MSNRLATVCRRTIEFWQVATSGCSGGYYYFHIKVRPLLACTRCLTNYVCFTGRMPIRSRSVEGSELRYRGCPRGTLHLTCIESRLTNECAIHMQVWVFKREDLVSYKHPSSELPSWCTAASAGHLQLHHPLLCATLDTS